MNADSRNEQTDFSLEGIKQQLRALSATEPPGRLREKLLTAVPRQMAAEAPRCQLWLWPRVTGWVSVAATILVLCGIVWLRTPSRPATRPAPDANSLVAGVLAADYNSVQPSDTNTLDSNDLY